MVGVRFKADKGTEVSKQLAEPWNSADSIADCKFSCVFKERQNNHSQKGNPVKD